MGKKGRNIITRNLTCIRCPYDGTWATSWTMTHRSPIPGFQLSPAQPRSFLSPSDKQDREAPRAWPSPSYLLQELGGIAPTIAFNLCISVTGKEIGQYKDTDPTADSKNFVTTMGTEFPSYPFIQLPAHYRGHSGQKHQEDSYDLAGLPFHCFRTPVSPITYFLTKTQKPCQDSRDNRREFLKLPFLAMASGHNQSYSPPVHQNAGMDDRYSEQIHEFF